MKVTQLLTLSASFTCSIAVPFKFPTPDGFPTPNATQLALIEKGAGGTLANSFLPTSLKSAAITVLQLLANNELFEVAFFTELLTNITNNVPGYDAASTAPLDRAYLIKSIQAIVNVCPLPCLDMRHLILSLQQEELHSLGASGILLGAGQPPIAPCQYQFPVCNFNEAILLAQTFTDIALGTIPEIQALFAADGGDEPRNVPLLGSILGQEAEQVGFFRYIQRKTPSAAPFLTGGSAGFAFTALQMFIVPDSCPKPLSTIDLPTFKSLTVIGKPQARNSTIFFRAAGPVDPKNQSVVYISGQNLPVTVPISQIFQPPGSGETVVRADFPFDLGFANGLTIAAIVNGASNLQNPDAVAAATIYGPGLIEVN
ncbi:MAG: hypothetical protein Q9220_004816 [cf. Caloplaca sp. 1 TL-2023]